jgi:hypothetical protein
MIGPFLSRAVFNRSSSLLLESGLAETFLELDHVASHCAPPPIAVHDLYHTGIG